jgi:ppGpp synthetase/RelA/SpoT-type nucleotidyltranferase
MPITDPVIKDAVGRYERERDRYIKLASRVADLCRTAIIEGNAIRAQVTSRTKTVRSFEGKLKRFSKQPDKSYTTATEIFEAIGDFAGVRIATYRPEDEVRVAQAVADFFCGPNGSAIDIDRKDKLNPLRGQFYRATHCQVHLPDSELVGNYDNLRGASCEIQICSMMAHVWNEIEHDIGYKPEGTGPSEAERGLLETLGHLARAGDAAITRLLDANISRMSDQTGDFTDVHDFVARLQPFFDGADLSVNAGIPYYETQARGLTSIDRIRDFLGEGALDTAVARDRIAKFNEWLTQRGRDDVRLNVASADLVTVSILDASLGEVFCSADLNSNLRGLWTELVYLYQDFKKSAAPAANDTTI